MALRQSLTAFNRVEQFNDNKTEQVWDVFINEFGRASVLEDGETGWKIAQGLMRIEEINKTMLGKQSAQCFARQCVHVDRRTTAAGISRINISILHNTITGFHPFLLRLQGLPHKACCAYQKSCTLCCALLLVGGKIELFWIFTNY